MKRIPVLTLLIPLVIIFGSCSVFQKNSTPSEKPEQEEPHDIYDNFIDNYEKDV